MGGGGRGRRPKKGMKMIAPITHSPVRRRKSSGKEGEEEMGDPTLIPEGVQGRGRKRRQMGLPLRKKHVLFAATEPQTKTQEITGNCRSILAVGGQ